MSAGSSVVFERARCALLNGLLADSLSLPVHWFYNPADIRKYFGPKGTVRVKAWTFVWKWCDCSSVCRNHEVGGCSTLSSFLHHASSFHISCGPKSSGLLFLSTHISSSLSLSLCLSSLISPLLFWLFELAKRCCLWHQHHWWRHREGKERVLGRLRRTLPSQDEGRGKHAQYRVRSLGDTFDWRVGSLRSWSVFGAIYFIHARSWLVYRCVRRVFSSRILRKFNLGGKTPNPMRSNNFLFFLSIWFANLIDRADTVVTQVCDHTTLHPSAALWCSCQSLSQNSCAIGKMGEKLRKSRLWRDRI